MTNAGKIEEAAGKHTPLPWRVELGSGGEIRIIAPRKGFSRNGRENEWAIAKVGDEGLWDEDGPEFSKEDESNAALIVRAVNAHEGLVKALKDIRDLSLDPNARATANAALKQSEGTQ